MRVTFVRHGESEANRAGRWQGQGDSPLSEHGRSQAAAAAARLPVDRFVRVVSSDLARARDTARATGREPEVERGLREIDVGRWEGMRRDEVLERFPEDIEAIIRGEDIRIGGGESWAMATERSLQALTQVLATHAEGDELAVFSHGGIITSLFLRFTRSKNRRPLPLAHMSNTAISAARFVDGEPVVERYNDALHVPQVAPSRRAAFGEGATVLGLACIGESADVEALHRARAYLEDVDAVVALAGTDASVAARVGEALERPVRSLDATDPLAVFDRHPGEKLLVPLSPDAADAAISDFTRPIMDYGRFARLGTGTLTHIARTRSSSMVADYGVRLHDRSPEDWQHGYPGRRRSPPT